MKKVLLCFMLLALLALPVLALAEGELPTDPFSWEQLATIAGATLATLLIVQLLKLPLDKVWKIPTRIVARIMSSVKLYLSLHLERLLYSISSLATTTYQGSRVSPSSS